MTRHAAPIPTEAQSQSAVIDWFDSYARTRGLDPRLLCASGNAAKRSYALAAALRKQGMRSGYPDLFLAVPRGVYHGFWIEMKRRDWKEPCSGKAKAHHDNQMAVMNMLSVQSFDVEICRGADDAIEAIKTYLE